jgi:6-phosphofructokinase 1
MAVQALREGQKGEMVGIVGGKIVYTPIRDTWEKKKELNPYLKQLVRTLW